MSNLFTSQDLYDLYGLPVWSEPQRTEHFTFNHAELGAAKAYSASLAIFFLIKLALFKCKFTLISYAEENVRKEIKHLRQRYFPSIEQSEIEFPKSLRTVARIETKVLQLVGFTRNTSETIDKIRKELEKIAPRYPKQRALARATIQIFSQKNISIPKKTGLEKIIREVWAYEQKRLHRLFMRHTGKQQRKNISTLLNKGECEQKYQIVALRQEMKNFNTSQIENALTQHALLHPIFKIADLLVPKLNIPNSTVEYYASLVDYYKGTRLISLNPISVQIYLLCYCFIQYMKLNDTLLEAFKRRSLDYHRKARDQSALRSSKQLSHISDARKKASEVLMAIKRSTHKTHIPKTTIFRYIPENELANIAKLLLGDELDPDFLFWQEIDTLAGSITRNLRPIYESLDLIVRDDAALQDGICRLNEMLNICNSHEIDPQCTNSVEFIDEKLKPYLLHEDVTIKNRFEFLVYYRLSQKIKSNKLTLKNTLKYKQIHDDLISDHHWKKGKNKILNSLPYPALKERPEILIKNIKDHNSALFHAVNRRILNGENDSIIIKEDSDDDKKWRLKPLNEEVSPNKGIFSSMPRLSIIQLLQHVDSKIKFSSVFDPISPRGAKHNRDPIYIMAAILANALRIGTKGMGEISDLNVNTLASVDGACLRMETLTDCLRLIYDAVSALPIFKKWNINDLSHASLDGLKLSIQKMHNKAQYSPKYFGTEVGVSSYNLILNHFPLIGALIGANEYEGHFAFELCQFQKISQRSLDQISTDKHGVNSINFLLFHLTNTVFAPRIPKPHNEILWGFDCLSQCEKYIIKPTKTMNEKCFYQEWPQIQHITASMLTGDANSSTIIKKLASPSYYSKTKLAFTHYNNIVKSNFILKYIDDKNFRHAIERALNRGEAFNRLYRSITLLNKGKLRGNNEVEMMVSDGCSRLLAAIILFFNSYILNQMFEKTKNLQAENFLMRASPAAWDHINLLGYYQFHGNIGPDINSWVKNWNWDALLNK